MKWIKLKTRPTTQEERDLGVVADEMYICETPDMDERVLVSNGEWVDADYWVDYGDSIAGFEMYDNYDPNELYWMPLPKSPHTRDDLSSDNDDINKALKYLKNLKQSMDRIGEEMDNNDRSINHSRHYKDARNSIVLVIDILQSGLDKGETKQWKNI